MRTADYKRRFEVLDMMLSSHSELRDRYRRRAQALTLIVMIASVAATLLALSAGEGRVEIIVSAKGYVWLAILSALIFALSIVELIVGWRECAWAHAQAALRLGELKGRFRQAVVKGEEVDVTGVDLDRAYDEVMNGIIEIPDRLFNRLKAKHRRKVAVSKLLDERPGAPILYLRWIVFRDGLRSPQPVVATAEILEESPSAAGGRGDV